MNIALIYFSGTGNTFYVAKDIKSQFEKYNHKVDIFSFDDNYNLDNYDLVGFGYPIYAFNIPKPILKIFKKLVFKNKKYFIFKTSGETIKINNASSRLLIRLINKRKGFLLGEYHFAMPYNIIFRFDDNFVKEQLIYEKQYVAIMVYEILNNNINKMSYNVFQLFIAWLCRLVNAGAKINSKFYRVNKKKCNNCLKCVNNCPFHNIHINNKGHIVFSNNCKMCMRCSFSCPNNAITIGLFNNWKVNGPYNFNKIIINNDLDGNYINHTKKHFYKCYRYYFNNIQNRYLQLLSNNSFIK
jgi:flavodoxin/NAD-dependent dihydropyrimidine dehydrogenase PreA subunit